MGYTFNNALGIAGAIWLWCGLAWVGHGQTRLDGQLLTVVNAPAVRAKLGVVQGATNAVLVAAGSNVTITTNATGSNVVYTIASTGGGGGPSTNLLVFTNDNWLLIRGSNGVVVAAGANLGVSSAGSGGQQTFTVSVTDTELLEWAGTSTNVWATTNSPHILSRQGGSAMLTNLAGLTSTNLLVFTNDNWLLIRGSNGVVVAAGAGISVASSGTAGQQTFTVTATGGGGGGGGAGSLPMNANQFDTNVTASAKNGILLTNAFVYQFLTLSNAAAPSVPLTNHAVIGIGSYAARGMLNWWDDKGMSFAVQPWLANNRVTMFYPSATTVIGAYGLTVPVNLGGVTVSHPPPTEEWPYAVQLATPATSNACAGAFSSIDMTTMGTRYGQNGYFFATEFLTTNRLNQHTLTAPAGNRLFIGRTSTASPNLTNIVNTTNGTGQYAGLYVDSGHTNQFYLTARDGTAEFRTNTGMLWVATNLYQLYLMQAPTSRFMSWRLRDLTSNTTAQGWFSNNVPTNMMKFGYLIRNGTTVVNSVRFTKIYVEAPLSP